MVKKTVIYSIVIPLIFLLSMLSLQTPSIATISNTQTKSNPNQSRTDQWIEDLQANYNNPYWFYNNLNSTDRLNIRNAFDFAISRSGIINSIANGFGSPLATYELPVTGNYYDSNVNVHPFNRPQSIDLLTKVFGYKWSPNDNTSTPYDESAPYFPLTLIVSNANQAQLQSANFINGILRSIGIGSTLVTLSNTQINNRLFSVQNVPYPYDFPHGGFDGVLLGFNGSILPNDGSHWFQSGYWPYNNYQYVNDTQINYLIAQENNYSLTQNQRIGYYQQMQQYVSNQSLKYILYQNVAPFIYNKNLQGFNSFYAVTGTEPYQNLSFSNNQNFLNIDLSNKWTNLNPLLANDTNSNYYINQLWAGGLLKLADQGNTGNKANYSIYGNLAYNNYTISPNQMFYNFTLKSGLRWSDGTAITAQDVYFTYRQILSPARQASQYDLLSQYLNNASIIVYDNYHIGFNLTNWLAPYPFAENLFTNTILPKETYNLITNWKTDQTNTGIGLTAQEYNSNGPYQISSINPSNGSATLKNSTWWTPSYASKFDAPAFNVSPKISTINLEVSISASTSLNNLVSGTVDWVDQQLGLRNIYSQILPLVQSRSISETNATLPSWVEFSLNQASNIWGVNPHNICYGGCGIMTISSTSTTIPPPTITSTTGQNQDPSGNIIIELLFLIFVCVLIYTFVRAQRKDNKKETKFKEFDKDGQLDLTGTPVIFCPNCGAKITKEDMFCANCGNRL